MPNNRGNPWADIGWAADYNAAVNVVGPVRLRPAPQPEPQPNPIPQEQEPAPEEEYVQLDADGIPIDVDAVVEREPEFVREGDARVAVPEPALRARPAGQQIRYNYRAAPPDFDPFGEQPRPNRGKELNKNLYSLVNKAPNSAQQADNFWPLPDTFIGIEMEIEGINAAKIDRNLLAAYWDEPGDGSLRGGTEFCLRTPSYGNRLRKAISNFFEGAKGYTISSRTSTHIHINMVDENDDADLLRNTIAIYIAVEDYFFSIAGDGRRWSGYCSPIVEAPPALVSATLAIPADVDYLHKELNAKRDKYDRYYALNLMSIARHGTLEFRHFQCAMDEETLIGWVKDIMYIKKAAIDMKAAGIDAAEVLADKNKVEDVLIRYIPYAEQALDLCKPDKIASKVGALIAYSDGQAKRDDKGLYKHLDEFRIIQDSDDLFTKWVKAKKPDVHDDRQKDGKPIKNGGIYNLLDLPAVHELRKAAREEVLYKRHLGVDRLLELINEFDRPYLKQSLGYKTNVDFMYWLCINQGVNREQYRMLADHLDLHLSENDVAYLIARI